MNVLKFIGGMLQVTIMLMLLSSISFAAAPQTFNFLVNSVDDNARGDGDDFKGNSDYCSADGLVDGQPSTCTLRDALNAPGTINITFDPALAGKTITLTNVRDGTFGPSALMLSSGTIVTIDGGKSGITITQNKPAPTDNAVAGMRLFYVPRGTSLTLKNLTLTGGVANGGNTASSGGGGGAGLGGAIINAGALTLTQTTLTNNQAQGGSNTGGSGTGGGGLGFNSPSGVAGGGPNGSTKGDGGFGGGGGSDIIGGNGGFGGGGAGGQTGGNGGFGGGGAQGGGAGGFGGGSGGGNAGSNGGGAGLGGALFNYGGTVNVTNSTLTGNSAKGGTGGNNGQGLGGAIFNLNGTINTTFTTIANNIAPNGGGAIYNRGDNGVATQTGPALPNANASFNPNTSIFSGSTDGTNAVTDVAQSSGNGGTAGVSFPSTVIIQTPDPSFAGIIPSGQKVDPQLSALANNGGPTQTMALTTASPAFDKAGSTCPNTLTDQRGVQRPQGAGCDIGAFELGQPVTIKDTNGNPVTLSSDKGGIANAQSIATPTGAPAAYTFANGFFSFDITGLTPGDTATVTMTLPAGSTPNAYIKCNAAGTTCSPFAGASINGNVVTLTLVDGGAGDGDSTKDGTIKDPGGPGFGGGSASAGSGGGAMSIELLVGIGVIGLIGFAYRRRIHI